MATKFKQLSSGQKKNIIDTLFLETSGFRDCASVEDTYKPIMNKYGISEKDIMGVELKLARMFNFGLGGE